VAPSQSIPWESSAADWITAIVTPIGFIAAVIAAGIAAVQFRQAKRATSAAAVMSIVDGLETAWQRFNDAGTDESMKRRAFGRLLNLLEVACAVYLDQLFVGRSGVLLCEFLDDNIALIDRGEERLRFAHELRDHPDTFVHILLFMKRHRR
jgi:hypothetical protein